MASGDFDADGVIDLVTANPSASAVVVLLGKGGGLFADPASYLAGKGASAVAVADFNGDGLPDLAVANYAANSLSILLNTSH